MSYPVLEAGVRDAERAGVCALAVMAKAPRAGKVKTRLAPALGFDGSAAINVCFLRDTARNIAGVAKRRFPSGMTNHGAGVGMTNEGAGAAGLVCYTPVGDEAAFDGLLPDGFALIAQRGDAFGERLLAAAEDILACGFGAVCLIDSDSPTLPTSALEMALEELLKPGDRVVLGGSDDGGYYLIGLKRAHKEPFERITWSTASVYAETVERCREAGIELVELPVWYDVDDAETLAVLERELVEGVRPGFAMVDGYAAEATREFLVRRRGSIPQGLKPASSREPARPEAKASGYLSVVGNPKWRAWATNAVLCVLGFGLLLLTREYVWEYGGVGHFMIGGSGCSGWSVWLYVAALVVVWTQPVNRATFGIVIGFALALRAAILFVEPFSSSDMYRYVWDGIVQHAGVNPYRYVPGDAALRFLRAPYQDVFDSINRRDYAHTIYPPVAQMVYWLVTFVSPTVIGMKAAMVGFECVGVGALVALLRAMGRRREEIVMYAWCPLLVWEIAGAGHVDAVVIAFVSLALLFRYREQRWLTAVFFALAVFTKFYPIVLLPAVYVRRDWKLPAVLVAVGAAGYAVYSSVGMGVFGFLGGYSKEEGIDSGARFFLLELAQRVKGLESLPVSAYVVFCIAVLGGLSVWAWRNASVEVPSGAKAPSLLADSMDGLKAVPFKAVPSEDQSRFPSGMTDKIAAPKFLRAAMMLGFAMMLLFSPHYPWYIVWLVPLLLLVPNLPLLAYVLGFFYLFTTQLATPGPQMFLLNEILYGGTAAMMLVAWGWSVVRKSKQQQRL
jgi:rSAM/selenodomain-associated transferase 1